MTLFRVVSTLVVATLLLSACSATVVEDPCDGAHPVLADCTYGGAWAECGGADDGPLFACYASGGGCLWFEHGCLAQGFVASSCAADDVCCIENFPYPASEIAIYRSVGLASFLSEWGKQPWDRARERTVTAAVASLAPVDTAIACAGVADASMGPCGTLSNAGRRYVNGDVMTTLVRPNSIAIGFWTLSIEVTRNDDAPLAARVCRLQSTDYTSFRCGDSEPACAVSGTLTLDAFPADDAAAATTRLELHAVFADGATIDAQLHPPPP